MTLAEKNSNCIFITGATGFLGTQVVRMILEQLEQSEQQIVVLVRAENLAGAVCRLEKSGGIGRK
jgi:thioester reductase-like protein